jgi:hypothetical protein
MPREREHFDAEPHRGESAVDRRKLVKTVGAVGAIGAVGSLGMR